MKKLCVVFLCLGLIGCSTAAVDKQYVNLYNEAVNDGKSVIIVKEGDFNIMKEGVELELASVGYNRILYSSLTEPFEVLAKNIDHSPLLNSDAKSHKIFLKYTKIDAGHTRIDLVNGGTTSTTKDDIDKDIQKLTELIKNNQNSE